MNTQEHFGVKLAGITAYAAHPSSFQINNIRENMKLNLPMISTLPEYSKAKGSDKKIALVGGGSSIKNTYHELKEFRTIFSCGSVNDFLMEHGIIPTYAVSCDPDPVMKNYFTRKDTEVKYLLSTTTHPDLVKDFSSNYQVIQWHCHSDDLQEEIHKLEKDRGNDIYAAIGGGCTVGLRTISLAVMFGYSNLHFFGFDSCMGENDEHHAYKYSTKEEIMPNEQTYTIRLGSSKGYVGDRSYTVCGYQLAQLENFKDFYCHHWDKFTPTFHGGGALSDYYDVIKVGAKEQIANFTKENLQ